MSGALIEDIRRYAPHAARINAVRLLGLLRTNYGLQALFAYRLGRNLTQSRRRLYLWPTLLVGWPMYYLLSRYVRIAYDIRLELSAEIGPGLYIGHFGNIHLRHCRIGRTCSIAQSVHIGPASAGDFPIIGDRVWIGAHARIVGPFSVGARSTLAAGALVKRDIPEMTLCVGRPARPVLRNYDNCQILDGSAPSAD